MNLLVIILGIVVVLLLWYVYTIYTSVSTVANNIDLSKGQMVIDSSKITNPTSSLYAVGVWVFVNNFSFSTSSSQSIVSFTTDGQVPTSGNELFNLLLDKNSPKLSCNIAVGTSTKGNQTILITNNFPLQTWVYVVVSVSSTFADTYINGKLVTSTKLTNSPFVPAWQNTSAPTFVTPANKPAIYLTGLSRWDNPIDPQTVWTAYSKGNGNSTKGSLGASYHLDMTLSKDDNKYKLAFF